MYKFISKSEKETIAFGKKLGLKLCPGDCLALIGDFGSGKTTFVKGLASGLGFKRKNYVSSPSFVILKIYEGRLPLYHFDVYRLDHIKDVENIGLSEFAQGPGVSVIEWADKVRAFLPQEVLLIEFSAGGAQERQLKLSTKNPKLKNILKNIHR